MIRTQCLDTLQEIDETVPPPSRVGPELSSDSSGAAAKSKKKPCANGLNAPATVEPVTASFHVVSMSPRCSSPLVGDDWPILNRGGVFNVMFNGERFTGQNANNEIVAKGNKGSTMTCRYTMPDAVASGSCAMSGGSTLNMKFD